MNIYVFVSKVCIIKNGSRWNQIKLNNQKYEQKHNVF